MGKGENEEFQLRQRCYPPLETGAKIKVSNTISNCIKVDKGGHRGFRRFRDQSDTRKSSPTSNHTLLRVRQRLTLDFPGRYAYLCSDIFGERSRVWLEGGVGDLHPLFWGWQSLAFSIMS